MKIRIFVAQILLVIFLMFGFSERICYTQSDTLTISIGNFQNFKRIQRSLRGFNITSRENINWIKDSTFASDFAELKPGLIRWPGGTKANNYNWIKGLDNPSVFNMRYLQAFVKNNNLEIDYMLNYGNSSARQAAQLVRFCNSSTPFYQNARAQLLGDSTRLSVKYWELGNEIANPWTFGVSWVAWDSTIRFRNGQTTLLSKDKIDSLYYFGGSFMREGWVPENAELNKVKAILGELYFPDSSDHYQLDIPVSFPRIGHDSIRVWAMISPFKKADLVLLTQQQIYNSITSPQYLLDTSQFLIINDSIVQVYLNVDAFDSITAILIEYNSVGHPGAFKLRDSMKAVDPSIEIGYQVNFSEKLIGSSIFTGRFIQSPCDFMISHMYNNYLELMFDNALYNEIVYRGTKKNYQHNSLQFQLDSLSGSWNLSSRIGQSFTEWNLSLCETNCRPGWYGMLIAMYTANFWSEYYRSAANEKIDIRTICHFATIASGQSPIHLFHNNGTTTSTVASMATRLVNQSLGDATSYLDPNMANGFPQMDIIEFDTALNSDTIQDDALIVWLGIDSLTMNRTLFILNRDSRKAYTIVVNGFEAQSAIIEKMKGNPGLIGYKHSLDTIEPILWPQDFTLDIDTFSLTSVRFNNFQINNSIPHAEAKLKMDFYMSPVPASNRLMINWKTKPDDNGILDIITSDGRKWISNIKLPLNRQSFSFDVSKWPSGIYFANLKNETGSITKKFIILH